MQILLAITGGLVAGVLLTVSDSVPKDQNHWSYWARVDTKLEGLHSAPAFYMPYPCKYTACSDLELTASAAVAAADPFSALTLLVGWQEGHPACKKTEWWGAGMAICLERDADMHTAQLMPLPVTVSCFSKIQIGFTFLVPAHPEKGPLNGCVCVRVCVLQLQHFVGVLLTIRPLILAGLSGRVVSASDCGVRGSRFESRL